MHLSANLFFWCVLFVSICGCQSSSPRFDLLEKQENRIKAWAYFYQGLVHEQNRMWTAAAENFHKAAIWDSENSRIYVHLSKNLFSLKKADQALLFLKQAEKYVNPKDYLVYFDIGSVYHQANFYAEAKRCYEICLAIFPKFEKGAQALADVSRKLEINILCRKEGLCQ